MRQPPDRKQQLIAAGNAYRKGMAAGREQMRESLQAPSLAKRAVSQPAMTAVSALRNRGSHQASALQKLLPLAFSGFSLVARKSAGRPLVRKVLVAGALGAIVTVFAKRKLGQWRATRAAKQSERTRR